MMLSRRVIHGLRAVGLAVLLVGWSFVTPRIPVRWRVPAQAGLAALLLWVTRAPAGLGMPRLWSGLRLGSIVAAAAAGAVTAGTSVPAVRLSMAVRKLPGSPPSWMLLQIPVGTVWAEEAAFRAALATAAAEAFGYPGGRLLQAVTFGFWHIADARRAGEPVLLTVLATGVAGWFFGWLADRSGSLAAPMLTHLAINETAAASALAIQRRLSGD